MNPLRWASALPLLSLGVHLDAQSPAFGLQLGFGQSRPAALDLASASATLAVDPATQQGLTLRGTAAWTLAPRWELEASLGWRARSSGGLDYRGSATGAGRLDVNQVLKDQLILGGLLTRAFQVGGGAWSLGAGLDLRAERLAAETAAGGSPASLTRPWLRALARYAWTSSWRPYLALEFAAPLSKPSPSPADYLQDLDRLDTASNPSAGSVAKAHAPSSELILAFGVRFPERAP